MKEQEAEMTALAVEYVMAQNNMGGPTVLASSPRGEFEVRWGGKGDPNGEDIQPVPPEIMKTVQFGQAVRKGIITLLGDEGEQVAEALAKQRGAFQSRMTSDELASAEAIDRPQDNDIIMVTCIGPSPKHGIPCGETAMVKSAEKGTKPDLCDRHIGLAPRYSQMPDATGVPVWVLNLAG
jgi:hypothetical protein